jgi:hypothetical protein
MREKEPENVVSEQTNREVLRELVTRRFDALEAKQKHARTQYPLGREAQIEYQINAISLEIIFEVADQLLTQTKRAAIQEGVDFLLNQLQHTTESTTNVNIQP